MDAINFLNAIFGDALGNDRNISIFRIPGLNVSYHATVNDAIVAADQSKNSTNVYFGLSLVNGQPDGRGKYEDAAAIGCLWADIDVLAPEHKKKNLPPTLEDARRILDRVGVEPSIIVHSGHGLQAYWLLSEPWIFTDNNDKRKAAELARMWVATIKAAGAVMGYDVDSVGDLPRIFRLPGTFNRKGMPIEVKVIESHLNRRYSPDDFTPYLVAEELTQEASAIKPEPVSVDCFALNPAAEPPLTKFLILQNNDPVFAKTWERQRNDFIDQSPSTYDMSLASMAARVGWTDQEIANLIIAFRRKYNDNVAKSMRRDYIQRTIAKAKQTMDLPMQRIASKAAEIKNTAMTQAIAEKVPVSNNERETILTSISEYIKIPISRWIKHGIENSVYSLVLKNGNIITIGGFKQVTDPTIFQGKIMDALDHYCDITTIKNAKKAWSNIVAMLCRVVETVENPESSIRVKYEGIVRNYLSHVPMHDGEKWFNFISDANPFIHDGKLGITLSNLMQWMAMNEVFKFQQEDVSTGLHQLGFVSQRLFIQHPSGRRHRRVWIISMADMPSDWEFNTSKKRREKLTQSIDSLSSDGYDD